MIINIDDIGIKYKEHFWKLDKIKKENSDFRMTAFVIAKDLTPEIIEWLKQDWIEVGVHCWDHSAPPEGECEDFEKRTVKALEVLKPLMNKIIYRPAGFQILASNYEILERLGIEAIIHQQRIQLLKEKRSIEVDLINKHIYDDYDRIFSSTKSIQEFKFISEII